MERICVGIVGLGSMSKHHIRNLSKYPHVQFVALCDISSDSLQRIGDNLNIPQGKRYLIPADLINDPDVHAIVNVTPNNVHKEVLEACILAGKPLLSEKPLTRTFNETVELLELYNKNPIDCMVAFSYRYHSQFRFAKSLVEDGAIGRVNNIFVQYLQGWGSSTFNIPKIWRFNKAISGTGTLSDLGSHMIDMARFFVGEFVEVSAQMKTIVNKRNNTSTGELETVDIDDFVSFQALLEGEVAGVFQSSRNAVGSGNQHDLSIYGEEGTIHVREEDASYITLIRNNTETKEVESELLEVPESFQFNQWDDFILMLKGTPPKQLSTFMDGFYNQQVMFAIEKSVKEKRSILINSLR
jgi:predicted dehydrogenase